DELPGDARADDALFAAAQLYEERLGDPARAAELYQRLVRDFGDSRVSLAAAKRLELLRPALGPGDRGADALAAMNRILHDPELDLAIAIADMEALIQANPDWTGLPDAVLWLGHALRRNEQPELALARYHEVATRWPASEQAFEALLIAIEVAAHIGQFELAERDLETLHAMAAAHPDDDPGRRRSLDAARTTIDREQTRAHLYRAAVLMLALVLIGLVVSLRTGTGSWRRAGRALARPPGEVLYMAPVAAVLVASALTGHEDVAPAVTLILIGGVAVTWLSGAGLAAAPAGGRLRPLLHVLASAAGVLAIAYIALHRTRLLDLIVSTVRFGPEV
ncbi:MAG TPA: tetratricopeptide repeat protein, partial [Kofleriaceae bacterium]|nr:tetratricopeptide repeat protein [Kofleriaceae bacterium]